MNQNLLITGASGFIGRPLCVELVRQGYGVVAALRRPVDISDGVEKLMISANQENIDWFSSLKNIDVIVHLAARVHLMKDDAIDPLSEYRRINVSETLSLARHAARAGVKRFIFISSIKVNGERTEAGFSFGERDVANPQDNYAISKLEAERGLLLIAQQTKMEIVIIRPPLVYGYGVKGNFANMLRAIQKGIPLPLGAIQNQRSFVYVGNLVSLIICCINNKAAANQIFLVSDGQDLSTTDLLRMCADALGKRSRLVPIPRKWVEFCARLVGKGDVAERLCGNLQVNIKKANEVLEWFPPYCVKEAFEKSFANKA